MMTWSLLILGFVLLLKGADFLIKGATNLAERMHVSHLVIGLTVVAIGTSFPELIIGIISNMQGNTDLILGNIFGSNLVDVLLMLGIAALIRPIAISKHVAWIDIPMYMGVSMILFAMMNNHIFSEGKAAQLTVFEGCVLLFIFLGYIYVIYKKKKVETEEIQEHKELFLTKIRHVILHIRDFITNEEEKLIAKTIIKDIFLIILGVSGLFIGGKLVVDNAVSIAFYMGMSESQIGLTVVSLGTTLPELITTIITTRKNKTDMAVGTLIGSNIVNIVLILGIVITTGKIGVTMENNIDFFVMFLSTLILWLFIYIGKKYTIEKWQGVLFLLMYFSYIVYRSIT